MRKIPLTLATTVAGLLITACGGASGSTGSSTPPTLTITSPENGDIVNEPFTLTFRANVPIGPPESGNDHVHVVADGKEEDYVVVTRSPYTINNLPAGTHRIRLTLQHADHSSAGADDEVTVQIDKGAKPSATEDDSGSDSGGGY